MATVPRQAGGPRVFTCTKCKTQYSTYRTHVMGTPIEQWWEDQGRKCTPCQERADQQAVEALDDQSIEAQFWVFHKNNPNVYAALVREGRVLLARGHRKLGIGMLYERLRWQVYIETVDDRHDFKLPNNYRAYYARLIMQQEADFEGVFRLAELRSRR